eukprot:5284386-Pyramimonas_sp.AAC.2
MSSSTTVEISMSLALGILNTFEGISGGLIGILVVGLTGLALGTSECVRVGVEGHPTGGSVPQTRPTCRSYSSYSSYSSYRSYRSYRSWLKCSSFFPRRSSRIWILLFICVSEAQGTLQAEGDLQVREFLATHVPLRNTAGVPGRLLTLQFRRQITQISSWSHCLPLTSSLTTKYQVPYHLSGLCTASFWTLISDKPSELFLA